MKLLLSVITLLFTVNTFSQKEANFWYFGRKAGINFNTNPPTAVTDGELETFEGCSSFSDTDGNLLFYVGAPNTIDDRLTVWDKNHAVMNYTDNTPANNLLGHTSSTQSAMIIPKPGSSTIYYIFTIGDQDNPNFSLYTIDISLNNGNGMLIDENNDGVFFENLSSVTTDAFIWTEKVAAVRGNDCDSYWVVSLAGRNFYSYHVTTSGVNLTPNISTVTNYNALNTRGYLKLSPNGEKLVVAHENTNGNTLSRAFIYSFDTTTGEVSNDAISLFNENGANDGRAYGVEFSIDSKKLYISSSSTFRNTLFQPKSIYKLFQYDVNSTDILNSKHLIYQDNDGFRGALQLGPNGKIYTLIPQAYDDINGDAPFLSAIENPTAEANDVIFTKKSIDLMGRFGTQGLPPFISSLLLPIEITDSNTGVLINNQNLKFCAGESVTLTPEDIEGSSITYEWFFNDGTSNTVIETTKNLSLTDLKLSDSGSYTLIVKITDNCNNILKYEGTFDISVFKATSATKPNDINLCDDDRDGFHSFDLQVDKNPEILNGQDIDTFEVRYFDSMENANQNNPGTALPNPYTNPSAFSSQTIYARVQNKNATETCFSITNFQLNVYDIPVPVQPSSYRLCDDNASGNDTDKKSVFNLESKDNEILGNINPNQFNVSYYSSLTNAQTNTNPIDKNAYTVTNSQTIYVRVENINNPNCNVISDDSTDSSFSSFQLIVDPLPIIKNDPATLKQCDDDPDLMTTFNLTEAEISISNNYTNETFEYYATQTDAINGTPQVQDKLRYPVNITGEAWVKTFSEHGCSRISKINLIVSYAQDVNYNREFVVCDDFLDADGNNTSNNSDTDGISFFDFSETRQEIINQFPPIIQPDLDVFYYETIDDRTAAINEIPDPSNHRNNNDPNYAKNQTIYFKIKSKTNNDCTGIGQFNLKVKAVPSANIPANFDLCDDANSGSTIDGENININLRDKVDDILGTTQSETDFIVSFHTSANGATTNSDLISNDTDFKNEAPFDFSTGDISEQTIYVRVQDRNGTLQCFNDHVSFKIIVNPLPVVSTTITPIAVCDIPTNIDSDPRNRIAQNIDLTSKNTQILNGRTNHKIVYYATEQHAIEGTPEISNPDDFQNIPEQTTFPNNFNSDDPGIQTIFFKVIELGGNQCTSVFSTFQLLIYPEPNIPENISNYTDCDNTSDSFNDDTNGINGNISLKNKIPEILSNYQSNEFDDFEVTFYESISHAESGDTSLAIDQDRYQNTTNNQTVYVRVENTKNTPIACIHTRLSFQIRIKPLPSFTVDDTQVLCLNDLPYTLEAENPQAIYDYIWRDENENIIGNQRTQNISKGGKYRVTASDQFPNGCSRSKTIVVKESNIATLLESYITIIDESNDISSQNKISISIDTITNNLGPGDYQFAIFNNDNATRIPIIGFQDEPLFENLEGGIYTVIVNDKNGCTPDATLTISVIQFPKFFTPNQDGINDTWKIKGANKTFYPNASINIFNKFGKLVAQIPIDSEGWDGIYGSKRLPSDDYWFSTQLIPADKRKSTIYKKGHFSLIRK